MHEVLSKPILSIRVIGSEDVNISELIQRLGNSDWVRQGYTYYKNTDGICPFCQRKVDNELEEELEKYFDEVYISRVKEIRALEAEYKSLMGSVMKQINEIIDSKNEFLDIKFVES